MTTKQKWLNYSGVAYLWDKIIVELNKRATKKDLDILRSRLITLTNNFDTVCQDNNDIFIIDASKINSKVRVFLKNAKEDEWNKVNNFIPANGELIIYNPDETHSSHRFKIGDGTHLVKDLPFMKMGVSPEDLENVTAAKLKHSLIFGAGEEFVFDGSKDVVIPVYTGSYNIG